MLNQNKRGHPNRPPTKRKAPSAPGEVITMLGRTNNNNNKTNEDVPEELQS